MQIRVYYDEAQLDSTVNYIATNHPNYIGQADKVRESILKHIQKLVCQYPAIQWIGGGMGYYVWGTMDEEEGIDSDENLFGIEFMVDPSIATNETRFVDKIYYKKLP
jgi:hypothetical protein